jgi:membrane protein
MARHGADRGRGAERPAQIPAGGWRDVAIRVKRDLKDDDISIVAGGVAFYGFLSVFPALAALLSIYGLLADPADVQRQVSAMTAFAPAEVKGMIESVMSQLAAGSSRTLSLGVAFSVLLALWSAAKGVKALIAALNIAFGEEERRGAIKLNAVALLFTLGAIVFGLVAVGAVVALPGLLGKLGLGAAGELLIRWLRWPVLAAMLLGALGVLYRYGPSRQAPRWRWVTPGSVVAAALWIGGSALFSWYVSNFGKYDKVYGSLGVIVILLTWFLLTAYVVLLGAELNAELERQTAKDTTTGPPRPVGERGAFAADTVGDTP